ncbi:MAG: DNA-binding protein [Intestinibacillus sp.]
MRLYLGVDTSNYRTSAAFFDAETGVWHNEGRLLDVPEGSIGLRQSEALFQHTLHLHEMIARLPKGAGGSIHAVGVSARPRAVEGSYMPCFLAGESVARSAAHLLDVPLSLCSHQQGHLAAAALSADALHLLREPFLAWHLSGGTTELLLVRPGNDGLPEATCIGGTSDLAAGQLIDRAGQLLGLAFPAGAALDTLALQAETPLKPFTPKVRGGIFSLSGVENKLIELKNRSVPNAEIARFAIETIARAVSRATAQALAVHRLPLLCAGGVMANTLLRAEMTAHFDAMFAAPELSGDNAVGAAVLAAIRNGGVV